MVSATDTISSARDCFGRALLCATAHDKLPSHSRGEDRIIIRRSACAARLLTADLLAQGIHFLDELVQLHFQIAHSLVAACRGYGLVDYLGPVEASARERSISCGVVRRAADAGLIGRASSGGTIRHGRRRMGRRNANRRSRSR